MTDLGPPVVGRIDPGSSKYGNIWKGWRVSLFICYYCRNIASGYSAECILRCLPKESREGLITMLSPKCSHINFTAGLAAKLFLLNLINRFQSLDSYTQFTFSTRWTQHNLLSWKHPLNKSVGCFAIFLWHLCHIGTNRTWVCFFRLLEDDKLVQTVLQSFIEQFYECRRKQWVGLHAYWGESKQHKCHACIQSIFYYHQTPTLSAPEQLFRLHITTHHHRSLKGRPLHVFLNVSTKPLHSYK